MIKHQASSASKNVQYSRTLHLHTSSSSIISFEVVDGQMNTHTLSLHFLLIKIAILFDSNLKLFVSVLEKLRHIDCVNGYRCCIIRSCGMGW